MLYFAVYFPKLTNMLSYFGVSMEPFDKSAFEFFHKIAKDVMDKRKSDEDKVSAVINNTYKVA